MSAESISHHLPYLRRFARALLGSQERGDAHVAATIEAMMRDPSLADTIEPKVTLYRTLVALGTHESDDDADAHKDSATPGERRLGRLTPRARCAFLLVSVEGLTEAEAADVLNVAPHELRALIEEAGREIAEDIATDVLIIEDEPFIALDLENLIQKLGHRVIGTARTHHEAASIARHQRPGLVLADIQLADGSSGLDAVNELLEDFEVPTIFITAYPERFLTGERPEPAFLISKPFQHATVSAVVSQALFFERNAGRRSRRVA